METEVEFKEFMLLLLGVCPECMGDLVGRGQEEDEDGATSVRTVCRKCGTEWHYGCFGEFGE